jgi:hypothetical protein
MLGKPSMGFSSMLTVAYVLVKPAFEADFTITGETPGAT